MPPPRTIGAPPTAAFLSASACNHKCLGSSLPIINLNTMNMLIFFETAAAMVKIMKSKLQEWYKGSRPNISDKGAMTAMLAMIRFGNQNRRTQWTETETKYINRHHETFEHVIC